MKKRFLILPVALLGLVGCNKTTLTSSSTKISSKTTSQSIIQSSATTPISTSTKTQKTSSSTLTGVTPGPINDDIILSGLTGYYDVLNDVSAESSSFKQALNNLLVSTHTTKIKYSPAYDYLASVDSYDGGDYVECIYTGQKILPNNRGTATGAWNREHMWAKSHGFPGEDKYTAWSDLHHLRCSEANINTARNNSYFAEVDHTSSTKDTYGNFWTSDVFEPRDEVKGDIARQLFYMVCRYDDSTLDLELTDDLVLAAYETPSHKEEYTKNDGTIGTKTVYDYEGVGYLGLLSTLVKWSYLDPVDDREEKRNEEIYTIQGNRNPFIDHPEFVYYLYPEQSNSCGVNLNNYIEKTESRTRKNETKLLNVENLISSIGKVTKDSGENITAARNAFDALDDETKSFVKNYDVLYAAEKEYEVVSTTQDVTVSTTISFLDADIVKNQASTLFKNGVTAVVTTPEYNAGYGIYGTSTANGKAVVSGLYDNIKSVTFACNHNKSGGQGKFIITDGTNQVEGEITGLTTAKGSKKEITIDVSSLDTSKTWTITIQNSYIVDGKITGSFRVSSVTFNI